MHGIEPTINDGSSAGEVRIKNGLIIDDPDSYLVRYALELDDLVCDHAPELVNRLLTIREIHEYKSPPADPEYRRSFEIEVRGSNIREDETQPVVWGCSKAAPEILRAALSREGIASLRLDASLIAQRKHLGGRVSADLIAEPLLAAAIVHASIGHSVEADNYLSYGNEMAVELGDRWSRAPLTVIDDPRESRAWTGTYAADDEGTPGQKTVVVEEGVWRGLLTSRTHLHRDGTLTGNGRRERRDDSGLPRNSVLLALPGNDDAADMIRSTADGYYCGAPRMSLSIGRNIIIRAAWARRIRNGQLCPDEVYEVEIRARKTQFLRHLTGIGQDLRIFDMAFPCFKNGQKVPVTLGSPTLAFGEVMLYPVVQPPPLGL